MGLELDGAVVVVTGAAGGIGAALVGSVRGRGRRRCVGTDLPGRGADVDLDVTDLDATRRAFGELRATRGRLDVVVANAGSASAGWWRTSPPTTGRAAST